VLPQLPLFNIFISNPTHLVLLLPHIQRNILICATLILFSWWFFNAQHYVPLRKKTSRRIRSFFTFLFPSTTKIAKERTQKNQSAKDHHRKLNRARESYSSSPQETMTILKNCPFLINQVRKSESGSSSSRKGGPN